MMDKIDNGAPWLPGVCACSSECEPYLHAGKLPPAVHERPVIPDLHMLTERHVHCLWFDSSLRPSGIRTASGEPVTVAMPGRWNMEAGPDFLDATLVIGEERRVVTGDIEIHIRPQDWIQHGHASDPRYNRVVAHVTYLPGAIPSNALPPGTVQIALRPHFACDPTLVLESIDVTAYPFDAPDSSPLPCHAEMKSWSPEDHRRFLDAAGMERMRRKTSALRQAIDAQGAEQTLYEETLSALGYKRNRAPMRRLARLLPCAALREAAGDSGAVTAYALLLGQAGLLPSAEGCDEEAAAFARTLWTLWWKAESSLPGPRLSLTDWTLSGIRPFNHPARRLAGAASLFTLGTPMSAMIESVPLGQPALALAAYDRILDAPDPAGYWHNHAAVGSQPGSRCALLGPDRRSSIISNVIVPFLAARGHDVTELLPMLAPEDDNGVSRQSAANLFGRDHNPALYRSGLRQQGLIQIFQDFCLTAGGHCSRCRLPRGLRQVRDGRE